MGLIEGCCNKSPVVDHSQDVGKRTCKDAAISSLRWTLLALCIIAAVAAVVGFCVSQGKMQVGLPTLNMQMSDLTAFYLGLAGGATFLTTTTLLVLSKLCLGKPIQKQLETEGEEEV